ncbi:hypothetical protein [Actinophytocola xanthii]|nr:hypothetical protein [Actinophytocola xanthii]
MPPRLLVAALVTALALLTASCGPDEPAGPDLSRFAAPATR